MALPKGYAYARRASSLITPSETGESDKRQDSKGIRPKGQQTTPKGHQAKGPANNPQRDREPRATWEPGGRIKFQRHKASKWTLTFNHALDCRETRDQRCTQLVRRKCKRITPFSSKAGAGKVRKEAGQRP